MDAVLCIFNAAKVPLEYQFIDMGKPVFEKGYSNGMTPQAQQTIEELGILFKGPMETLILKSVPANYSIYGLIKKDLA